MAQPLESVALITFVVNGSQWVSRGGDAPFMEQGTVFAPESEVLSAWYCSRPEVRRLLAIRDSDGLRVFLQLEPAQDSGETHPAWMANRHEWANELRGHTGAAIRLEKLVECDDADASSRQLIVADLSWRDPSFIDQS